MVSLQTANLDRVNQGLRIVREALSPVVYRELVASYGQQWWAQGVLLAVSDAQRRDLPARGTDSELLSQLDIAAMLNMIERRWNDVFRKKFNRSDRNWVNTLIGTRNEVAHHGAGDLSDDKAWYGLQTMVNLLEGFDANRAAEIRKLAAGINIGGSVAAPVAETIKPKASKAAAPGQQALQVGVMPWRDVVQPHADVAQGRYQVAQFAADLSQVVAGRAEPEYQDPGEFFARTFLTDGMSRLLTSAVERLAGKGGDPVIQLKTAFGGGKTHSMLALYHLLKSGPALENLASVQEIERNASLDQLPKANTAVIVGTALDPARPHLDAGGNGVEVRTLWGEMAAQLGGREGYEIVRASDEHGSAPGSSTLIELFDRFAPSAVLIDELVAYARAIHGTQNMPSGSFDAVLTFVQNLTEAVKAADRALLVAAIPESDVEAGGDAGKAALERLEKTFGRVEAVWQPVVAEEGFEVVRRRLFSPVKDEAAREAACLAFSKLYGGDGTDFPKEAGEMAYLDRLRSSYPIHPELFARLYEDWSTLESFQRTRGVLRLMAAAIHVLWMRDDRSPMIMPGDLPMDERSVRDELLRYLSPVWNGVVDNDVDGPGSEPLKIDKDNPRFGQVLAAERCARAIFLGSAPQSQEHRVRGLEDTRVRLGVVRPGESCPVYNDAMSRLTERLTYLFSGDRRYWYDTHPNVIRTAEERARRFEAHEVEQEISDRLRERNRAQFAAVHQASDVSGADVPDEQTCRLVVLGPDFAHAAKSSDSPALKAAATILDKRGNAARIYRNTLVFVVPDKGVIDSLRDEVRLFLAWQWVLGQKESLNLDQDQLKHAEGSRARADSTVTIRLREAYCWLLVPSQVGAGPWQWDATRLQTGDKGYVERASDKVVENGIMVIAWSPILLKRELDGWLWKQDDFIGVRKLWEHLCSYGYLSRLRDVEVLKAAIAQGARSSDFFGYAGGVSDTGRYEGLIFDAQASSQDIHLDGSSVLVKPEKASDQVQADLEAKRAREQQAGDQPGGDGADGTSSEEPPETGGGKEVAPVIVPVAPVVRHFHGSTRLDPVRPVNTLSQIHEEIVANLASLPGARVTLTIEIDVTAPDGISDTTQRVVSENSRTLKLDNAEFD